MALILYYAKHRKNPFIRPITQTAGGNKDFARLSLLQRLVRTGLSKKKSLVRTGLIKK